VREHRDPIGNPVHGGGSEVLERVRERPRARRIWLLMRDVERPAAKDTSVLLWVLALLLLGWAFAFVLLLLL
jgi:hypothetical protein